MYVSPMTVVFTVGCIMSSECHNVALLKPAYQTDTWPYVHAPANLAVYGDVSQLFSQGSCSHTQTINVNWEVDLQGIYMIGSVKLYNRLRWDYSFQLHNVKVYVGMTRKDTNRLIGFHPGEIDSTATFALRPNVYVRWIRITKRFPTHYLSLCEVQVEGYQSYVTFKQFVLRGEATNNVRTVRSIAQCAFVCSRDVHCLATQYNETSQSCQAFNTLAVERVSDVTATILVNAYFADQVRNAK